MSRSSQESGEGSGRSSSSPLVLFTYNRPEHTTATIEALVRNSRAPDTDLFIFSDGPRSARDSPAVEAVRRCIDSAELGAFFRSVHVQEEAINRGLAQSVIAGVTKVLNEYGRAIVVEDDHVTSPDFLDYMNRALDRYESDDRVWSISGYSLPLRIPRYYTEDVYFLPRASSWGYATWSDRWELVDWNVSDYEDFIGDRSARARLNKGGRDMASMLDAQMEGRIDSWAIRWCYAQSRIGSLTMFPAESLVQNTGLDGSGTHSGRSDRFATVLRTPQEAHAFCDPFVDRRIARMARNFYLPPGRYLLGRVGRIRRLWPSF